MEQPETEYFFYIYAQMHTFVYVHYYQAESANPPFLPNQMYKPQFFSVIAKQVFKTSVKNHLSLRALGFHVTPKLNWKRSCSSLDITIILPYTIII